MTALDELRKFYEKADGYEMWTPKHKAELDSIANAIEAELAERYIARPLDADGVPWHLGDVTENGNTIYGMGLNKGGWYFMGTVNDIDPTIHRHHPPTVEDVLKDFIDAWAEWKDGAAMMNPVETFAAKLRLASDDE